MKHTQALAREKLINKHAQETAHIKLNHAHISQRLLLELLFNEAWIILRQKKISTDKKRPTMTRMN